MPQPLLLPLLALGLAASLALLAWLWQRRLANAGVIDIAWGLNLSLAALLYAALAAEGWAPRRWALAAMVGLTGLRLSYHIARRTLGHEEEGRYQAMRREWSAAGADVQAKLLSFFLLQALLVPLLSAPYLAVALNPDPAAGFSPFELAGIALFLLGFAVESLADRQLAAFKAQAGNRGKTCRRGLWRLSRHPNYFGEWLMWLSYWLYACGSPWGWASVFAPLLMLYFLLKVTGVKLTEEQCLRSRGEDYARYQRETSMFLPWFPRPEPSQGKD